jgi:hypothetical protein
VGPELAHPSSNVTSHTRWHGWEAFAAVYLHTSSSYTVRRAGQIGTKPLRELTVRDVRTGLDALRDQLATREVTPVPVGSPRLAWLESGGTVLEVTY